MGETFQSISLTKILFIKFLRVFITALMAIVLPIYLLQEGYSVIFIGIIISLTILSNIPFNILVAFFLKNLNVRWILTFFSLFNGIVGHYYFY